MVNTDPKKGAAHVGDWVLLVLELIFISAIVYGVWQIFEPAAWIVGGVAGIVVLTRMPGFLDDVLPKKPVRR